jgi:hypothetical protein
MLLSIESFQDNQENVEESCDLVYNKLIPKTAAVENDWNSASVVATLWQQVIG